MNKRRRSTRLLIALAGISLVAAACGDDDDNASTSEAPSGSAAPSVEGGATTEAPSGTEGTTPAEGGGTTTPGAAAEGAAGGEFIDGGTFVGDPPEHIDPALNTTLDAYQVINAMYDGLTDIDTSDPANPKIVPHMAESFESNDDATVWTFKVKEGLKFSNGEEILPSTFARSWERASDPEDQGDYAYLMNFIQGGAEKLAGEADTLAGVVADDEAMTLTVTLSAPYSNFPAVAGFQLFMPMPEEAGPTPGTYENGLMAASGPYKLAEPRTDDQIVLVKNEDWAGDINGETWPDRLDQITFLTYADPDTSFNALSAGETMTAQIPPARVTEADETFGTTLDVDILGTYFFQINDRAPEVGGEKNLDLRRAISMAIDREKINNDIYNGSRNTSTGITPPGIPGFKENLCSEYCTYDPEGAAAALEAWKAANPGVEPPTIKIQFNAGAGHEDVVAIVIQNLAAIGITAEADPRPTETYFSEMSDGSCVVCRSGWFADYPTYDNFMYDQFATESLGGNNFGYSNPEFDQLLAQAKQTVDPAKQAELFQQTEDVLLNQTMGAIPINWYRGDYAYDEEQVAFFTQSNFGLIPWEQITLAG